MQNIEMALSYPLAITRSLGHALSTIKSPAFSQVIVLYQDNDIPMLHYQWYTPPVCDRLTSAARAELDSRNHKVFEVLQEMWRVHNFTLVLCAMVWGCSMEYAVQELKWMAQAECTEGSLNCTSSQVLVTFQPREFLPALSEQRSFFVEFSKWVHPWAPKFIE
jgi:hypothetical protein